jgi:predicted anti-sigma-YlaC factor YlaD
VNCAAARTAVSTGIDEGLDDLTRERAAAHLADCQPCRSWQELAHVVTRRTRMSLATAPPTLAAQLGAAVQADVRRRRVRRYWLGVARAVALAGLLQLLATVPLLVLARTHTSGSSRVHVLGLVELAIGAGFFIGALVVLWQQRDLQVLELAPIGRTAASRAATDVSEVA